MRAQLRIALDRLARVALVAFACGTSTPAQSASAPQGVRLRARVVDSRWVPIAGAKLAFVGSEELTTNQVLEQSAATSGEDGVLSVDAPAAFLALPSPAKAPHFLLAARGKVAVTIRPFWASSPGLLGSGLDLGVIVLYDAITLRGRVNGGDGKPLPGVRVIATDGMRSRYDTLVGGSVIQGKSIATTDASGSFVLPCVPDRGLELTISAEGHYTKRLYPVGRETPLVVDLERSGYARGRAFGPDRKPFCGLLSVHCEFGSTPWTVETAADGTFQTTVAHRGRFLLRSLDRSLASGILEGPANDVEVVPCAVRDARTVIVTAIDAKTGEELAAFRAIAFWDARNKESAQVALLQGRLAVTQSDARRKITLVPTSGQSHGNVFVQAEGHAPAHVEINLDENENPKLVQVALGPEAVVKGRILDAHSKPLPSVEVWASPVVPNMYSVYTTVPDWTARSDAEGRFTLRGLGAGQHIVQAYAPGRLLPPGVVVEASPEKPIEGLEIKLLVAHRLQGKLTGKPVRPGWTVRIEDASGGARNFAGGMPPGGATFSPGNQARTLPIAPDGTFTCEGLDSRSYRVSLVMPNTTRLARPLEFALGDVQVSGSQAREFDSAKCEPAKLSGRVQLGDVAVPMDRLVVVANPAVDRGQPSWYQQVQKIQVTAVELDGRFELLLVPGEHELRVLDVATGAVLGEVDEPVVVPFGKEVTANLVVRATRVHVTLEAVGANQRVLPGELMITGVPGVGPRLDTFEYVRSQLMLAHFGEVLLEPGQRELDLWLPAREYNFALRSRLGMLAAAPGNRALDTVSQRVSVPEKTPIEVRLEIPTATSTADLERK